MNPRNWQITGLALLIIGSVAIGQLCSWKIEGKNIRAGLDYLWVGIGSSMLGASLVCLIVATLLKHQMTARTRHTP